MLRKNALRLLAGLVVLTSSTALVGTIAWFLPTAKITKENDPIKGIVEGAYFAYGNGSPESLGGINKPFGINKPRHLYNLAWLTYLGYFKDKQYYFEIDPSLTTTLDMDGWILPPIGTPQYPFMGNFNGNGKIIENLAVSNSGTELTASTNKHPAAVSGTDFDNKNVNIVGVFGTIGNLPSTSYTAAEGVNKVYNLGLTDITVKTTTSTALIGSVAGYVNGTLEGVAIDNGTVNIPSATSALGTLGTDTISKLSEYTIVGYATTNYKRQITRVVDTIYDVNVSSGHEFNATEQGASNDWGGSINMKTIYERLYGIKHYELATKVSDTVPWRITRYYYDGVENTSQRVEKTDGYKYGKDSNGNQNTARDILRYDGTAVSGHDYIGNYNFFHRGKANSNYNAGDYDNYMYLVGGHDEIRNYRTNSVHTGYYITDGTNYLYYTGSGLDNTTNTNTATLWNFDNINATTFTTKISMNYESGSQNRWLRNNGGTLEITNNEANGTTWTVTRSANNVLEITSGTYSLTFDGSWGLYLTAGTTKYRITNGTQYMVGNASASTAVSSTTNQASATLWTKDNNNNFYFSSGGTNYYLARRITYSTDWRTRYTTSVQYNGVSTETTTAATGSPQIVRYTYNSGNNRFSLSGYTTGLSNSRNLTSTTYYINYNNGWKETTTATALTVQTVSVIPPKLSDKLGNNDKVTGRIGPDYYQTAQNVTDSTNNSHMYYTADNTTYLPLNVAEDGGTFANKNAVTNAINAGNFDPVDANTGYIISGSNLTGKEEYSSAESNIRVSKYAISNLSNSFNHSSGDTSTIADFDDSKIYTLNKSGNSLVTNTMSEYYSNSTQDYTGYVRYKESRQAFYENSLTTAGNNNTRTVNGYVYGLHFMDSTISKDSVVNAEKVSILGNKCVNYELPVDSIDFNLKQKGYINFFAGTYFDKNNSFFSLHQIIRNNDAVVINAENQTYTSWDTIKEIREIVEVWSVDNAKGFSYKSNIYKYKYKDNQGNTVYSYSEPYRVDGNQVKYVMNKNNTDDNPNLYTDNYDMDSTDFNLYVNTHGYTKRFDTTQIGAQASVITSNRLYYFEMPMNSGEYCLGSVPGGTGCYLLYLDIGANASKTRRTIVYEHFKVEKSIYEYPLGVAVTNTSYATKNNANFSDTDTVLAYIKAAYTGTVNITRVSASEATIARSGTLTNAKPTLVGELMWDSTYHRYNIHIPNGDNVSASITPALGTTTEEYQRLQYYDWNVNAGELTVTVITDKTTSKIVDGVIPNGGAATTTRSFEQIYSDGTSTTNVDEMKIYNTNGGTRYASSDLTNPSTSTVKTYDTTAGLNSNVIAQLYYILGNIDGVNITSTETLKLVLVPDVSNNYSYSYYLLDIEPSSGTTTVRVIASGNIAIRVGQDDEHYVTITINIGNGNAEQTITVPVS